MAGFALYLRVCCGLRSRIAGVCLKTPEIEFPTEDRKGKQRHGSSIPESAISGQPRAEKREGQVLGKTPSAHSRAQPPPPRAKTRACRGPRSTRANGILYRYEDRHCIGHPSTHTPTRRNALGPRFRALIPYRDARLLRMTRSGGYRFKCTPFRDDLGCAGILRERDRPSGDRKT